MRTDVTESGNTSNHGQDAEDLAVALDLEAARPEKRQLFRDLLTFLPSTTVGSTPELRFADSPSRVQGLPTSSTSNQPSPPDDFYQHLSKILRATTSRAEDAELALHNMEVEIRALGFSGEDSAAVITGIASQFRTARLELERTVPGETVSGFENAKVLTEIMAKLKILARRVHERESELKTMRDQQKTLKGNFEHGIMAAEKANARVRELEDAIETGAEEMLEMRNCSSTAPRTRRKKRSSNSRRKFTRKTSRRRPSSGR